LKRFYWSICRSGAENHLACFVTPTFVIRFFDD
jgi:hypothetical protein